MIEILQNTAPTLYLNVYAGVLDSTPECVVSFGEEEISISPLRTSPTPSGVSDQWGMTMPLQATESQQEVLVTWTFEINNIEYIQEQRYDIATPLIFPIDAARELGFSLSPQSSRYRSEQDIITAERIARYSIEQFTSVSFGREYTTVTTFGQSTDVLVLNEPIITVDTIKEDDVLIYDRLNDVNTIGYDITVTESGRAIRIFNAGNIREYEKEPIINIASTNSDPSYSSTGLRSAVFKGGKRYEVTGEFGFRHIPADVRQAAVLLINDFLCQDSIWRQRFVQEANMSDFKLKYSKEAFFGTGNVLADRILSKYNSLDIVVI